MSSDPAPILSIIGLRKTYTKKTVALDGIDLTVHPGEFVAVVGPSGAGKSTLLRCINRLVAPDGGDVFFDGEHISDARPRALRALRARIGMIFQHHCLISRTSVLGNVLHGLLGCTPFYKSLFGAYPAAEKERAWALLQSGGLTDQMYQKAGTLSGGQMQRVGICRALMQRPRLLLADEPIASLDPGSAHSVMEHIQAAAAQHNLAVVINLHQVEYAKQFATRIIGMKAGRIVFDGPPDALSADIIADIYESENDDSPTPGGTNDRGSAASGQPAPRRPTPGSAAAAQMQHLRGMIWAFCAFFIVAASFMYLSVRPSRVFAGVPQFFRFFAGNFWPPNFSGFGGHLPVAAVTVLFAVVATYIAAVLAFLLGALMAPQINPILPLRAVVRALVSVLRNVPLVVWGTLMVFVFGIGPLVGVVALVLTTLGFLARSYAESMDEIAAHRLWGLQAVGAGRGQLLYHGLLPEFLPAWANWTLFTFELNIRASAVLGMVGAGGLGLLIQTNLDLRGFRRAFALIIILAALVLIVEFVCGVLRRRINAYKERTPTAQKFVWAVGALFFAGIFWASVTWLNLDMQTFIERLPRAANIMRLMWDFNPAALPEILRHLLISVTIGIAGLASGFAVSFVLAFLAASTTAPWRPLAWAINGAVSIIRAVPGLVLILLIVASLGFGFTTAVVAIMFPSIGFLTRAFVATIEEQDIGIIESMKSTGASRLQIVWHGVLPGVMRGFISWLSIRLEGNIADSVSLGVVGAGGVGMLIARAVRGHNFANLTTTLVVIFVAMLVLEFLTSRVKAPGD